MASRETAFGYLFGITLIFVTICSMGGLLYWAITTKGLGDRGTVIGLILGLGFLALFVGWMYVRSWNKDRVTSRPKRIRHKARRVLKGIMLLTMATFGANAEESAAELQAKLEANGELKQAAMSVISRHAKFIEAAKPGRLKVHREQINKLLDKMEVEAKKNQQPIMIEGELIPLKSEVIEAVDEYHKALMYKPEMYEHEMNMAIKYYKEAKTAFGKQQVLKEVASTIAGADKIAANPKVDAAEVKKIVDAGKK